MWLSSQGGYELRISYCENTKNLSEVVGGIGVVLGVGSKVNVSQELTLL